MENAIMEWKSGIFEIWQTTEGKFYAVNNVLESEQQITASFAKNAMSHTDEHFIDEMSLLTFD
jgi:hypothetical protein